MKKIGEGWDYTVYAISADRVRKVRKTSLQLSWLLVRTFNIVPLFKLLIHELSWGNVRYSLGFVQEFISQHPEYAYFFGNPAFFENDTYEQDNVIPLRDYFAMHSETENKVVIENYMKAMHWMWVHNFSDTSFKFSKNYAVDNQGRVILIDFSNITQDRDSVEVQLNKEFPLKVWVYRKMTDFRLKQYYREQVRISLNRKKLLSLWK